MRARTLLLVVLAIVIAGITAMLARTWLAAQRAREVVEAPATQQPAKSVLVARVDLKRGQILRPDEMVWQIWPEGGLDKNYLVMGGPRTPESVAGWVVKNPITGGEPITEGKIIAPGDRGFLAAVLNPGMRAISVPVSLTSSISGLIFPGDRVDLLLSYLVPAPAASTKEGETKQQAHEQRASQTVLRNIRVIGIDQRLDAKQGEAFTAPHNATFEVTPKQSEVIALASEIGKVSLTLRSLVPGADDAEPPAKVADAANGAASDSSIAESATYTLDSDISPLLPKRAGGKDTPAAGVVTILRGSGKESESKASAPAPKGS